MSEDALSLVAVTCLSSYQGEMYRPFHYGWVILAMGTLVVFASVGLARFGYTMLLPSMQSGIGMDNTDAGILATANLIGYLVFALAGGALASRLGPRYVISIGLGVVAVGMLLTGMAASFSSATIWRALTGIGSGMSNVPVMAVVAMWFVRRRRGFATGIAVTGSSFALIVLGPFVPWILHVGGDEGWRICWFVFAAVALVLAVLSGVTLRDRPALMGLRPLGAEDDADNPSATFGRISWAAVYRSRDMWIVGLLYVAFGFSYIIYMTFFTKYLVAEAGYTAKGAGQLFMLMGWFSLSCGFIWGSVSDVIGRRNALAIVYLIHSIAFALFVIWPRPAGLTLSAILFGITAWSTPAIMAAICGDLLGARLAPAGLGFVTVFLGIGQAAGPAAAGRLADHAHALAPAFLLAASVAFLGMVACFLLRTSKTYSN